MPLPKNLTAVERAAYRKATQNRDLTSCADLLRRFVLGNMSIAPDAQKALYSALFTENVNAAVRLLMNYRDFAGSAFMMESSEVLNVADIDALITCVRQNIRNVLMVWPGVPPVQEGWPNFSVDQGSNPGTQHATYRHAVGPAMGHDTCPDCGRPTMGRVGGYDFTPSGFAGPVQRGGQIAQGGGQTPRDLNACIDILMNAINHLPSYGMQLLLTSMLQAGQTAQAVHQLQASGFADAATCVQQNPGLSKVGFMVVDGNYAHLPKQPTPGDYQIAPKPWVYPIGFMEQPGGTTGILMFPNPSTLPTGPVQGPTYRK
jgi:hypothetical protein